MKTNAAGIELLKEFEGFRGDAYLDMVGVKTIGWGFIQGVELGDKMTRAQADKRLLAEIEEYESAVFAATGGKCNQNQFSALVVFSWNIGINGFKKSTVLKCHNRSDWSAAARAFAMWSKAGGKTVAGLVRRRAAEAALYLKPVEGEEPMPQVVDAEKPIAQSSIVSAGTATAVVSTLGVGAQIAQSIAEIRTSLGDLLPYLALVAGVVVIGFGLYTVLERLNQRRKGVA